MHVHQNTELTDEEVAIRVQKGDTEMFGVLVDRFEQKLLRYGRKFLSQREDIEDIVQDAFVNAYRNIQSFDAALRFSPWMYRIAHNAFVNALRKNEHRPIALDMDTLLSYHVVDDAAESEREQKEIRTMLERGIEKIPLKYREVLVLHYFEDLSYKDISDILHIPMGTVSVRLRRGKEALKKQIDFSL